MGKGERVSKWGDGREKKKKGKWALDNWVGLKRFWAWINANGLQMTKGK